MPPEMEAGIYCQRYGAISIFGRPLTVKEARAMALMNRILDAYQARETSPDYVQWEKDHPEDTELLAYAARIENE